MSYHLFSMPTRTAAKQHRCIWCGEYIERGGTYLDERSVFDGSLQRLRWHPECRDDAEEYWREGGDAEFMLHSNDRPGSLPAATTPPQAQGQQQGEAQP